MRKKWSENEKLILKQNYHLGSQELSKLLGRTKRAVEHQLSNLKLYKESKYFDNFFEAWSNDMAYILGFVTADGCITYDRSRLSFGISSKDLCLLEFINNRICKVNKIHHYLEKRIKHHQTSRLRINSKQICQSLEKYGICPRKTGKETLPDIPEEFKSDYLRGLFDGDGCIHITNKKTGQLSFSLTSASCDFLMSVQKELGFNLGYIRQIQQTYYRWLIYKQEDIKRIGNFIYSNKNGFCLQRKKEKFKL